MRPTEQTHQVGQRSGRIVRQGSGEPVVWLHDTLGNTWTAAHAQLSQRFEVIAPSLPGFDDSSTLGGIDAPEDVVFWLLDLLAELRLERPTLVGCGLGGWMAAEFAVRYPERLGRMVLVDAYGLKVSGALAEDEFALTPVMLRPLVFADPTGELSVATLPDQAPAETLEANLHARVAAARLAWQFPYDRKLRSRLHRASMPTLVIWGEHDRLVPTAHAHAFADGLPDARLEVIQGAAHYPHLEQPATFTALVEAFLTSEP